jgi:CRISPR-associated protein Cmr5
MALQKTLEQGRAEYAYKCAEEGKKYGTDYKSYVKKIPMLIKTNGLGATMAFVFSKSKGKDDNAYGLIYKQTAEWIKERTVVKNFEPKDLAKKLTEIESSDYRAVTNEVLALFTWLRRFAEGLITKD